MENETTLSKQPDVAEAVDNILENLPSELEEVIDLPSRSKFYSLKDPAEGIKIRPMNFSDEKAIVQAATKDSINILLTRCVSNIDVTQLLQFDKLYLLMKIREVSFGSNYSVNLICDACNNKNVVTYDIGSFRIKLIPEDLEDPRDLFLEAIGKTAKVRFPRVQDEVYITNSAKVMDNLWRFVVSIDGHDNKAVISKVIQKLPSKDVHLLMNDIFGSDYGLDTKGQVKCDSCGHIQISELPIGTDFFTLS
jgi:hypothetical protein|tara:strand:- start:1241 stop:1990 length:750 start_codon:yes stop_codon:yes gene_type:complete